jgi:D-alanyl-lipoteichoic acid acyltransferase DltB (MBOAT superfamily)
MLFNSYNFILAFLPLALVLFFTVGRWNSRAGKFVLLALSLYFISCTGISNGLIALGSALVNFCVCRLMCGLPGRKKPLLTAGILFNVGLLCLFKYVPGLGFPLGISFYCFQQIAFLVESSREPTEVSLTDYSLFVLFFPKAVQGPIPYGSELLHQLQEPDTTFRFERFSRSLFLFSLGLAKKVLVADKFAIIADFGFGNIETLTAFESLLTILAYTFQLYFDFSGYSDMAVAVGWMFGFELPWNFDSPYKAKNITDFWRRWHITLSRFLTKYIYIPLGGSRKGIAQTFLNILIVYLVSGIWHGTGMTFLVWGLLHAGASIAYRLVKKPYDRLPGPIQWMVQFAFVNVTWVFFRAPSLQTAQALLSRLFSGSWMPFINAELTESLLQPTFISLAAQFLPFIQVVLLAFGGTLILVAFAKNSRELAQNFRAGWGTLLVAYLLLLCSILSMSGVSSFLYTNF